MVAKRNRINICVDSMNGHYGNTWNRGQKTFTIKTMQDKARKTRKYKCEICIYECTNVFQTFSDFRFVRCSLFVCST